MPAEENLAMSGASITLRWTRLSSELLLMLFMVVFGGAGRRARVQRRLSL